MADWLITYGSWCLAPFGLLGMWVVGRKQRWGWVLSMGTQALWAFYAIGTGQYGFLIGTVSYFCIYAANWLKWRRDDAGHVASQRSPSRKSCTCGSSPTSTDCQG
jgi:hypothetical protein